MKLLKKSLISKTINRQLLYNPFHYVAGVKSFTIGFTAILITSFLAYITGTHFYGLTNINFAKDSAFWVYLFENVAHWIFTFILLWAAGAKFSKSKVRLIDVIGTIALARIPLIILPIIRLTPFFESFPLLSVNMFFLVGMYLLTVIWSVVLMFNAYKVTCNLKQERLIVSFIVCLFLSEILTKVSLYYFTS